MSRQIRILITDRFALGAETLLKAQPHFHVEKSRLALPSPEELQVTEALIIRSRTQVDQELLALAPQLKVIVTATSGFDHIDLEATQRSGVTVMHTPNGNLDSAAELTWGLVLACARRIPQAHRAVKAGDWSRDPASTELFGKTYGVVGFGRIGRKVGRIANAFGMNVVTYDPYIENSDLDGQSVLRLGLEELLKQVDVISFHVPKTPETHHLVNRSTLESLNRGAILINTSRGSVVREEDLIWALEQGWIAAVGLDVFAKEPIPRASRLLSFSEVIVTPHLGASTREAFDKVSTEAAQKVIQFFTSGATADLLPPQTLWYQTAFAAKKH